MSNNWENENTPLQLKLKDLTKAMSKIASIAGGLLFVSLLLRYFEPGTTISQRYSDLSLLKSQLNFSRRTPSELGVAFFVKILIISVTVMVVAVPEGNIPAHADVLELTL